MPKVCGVKVLQIFDKFENISGVYFLETCLSPSSDMNKQAIVQLPRVDKRVQSPQSVQ